jgi:hypothetical protein
LFFGRRRSSGRARLRSSQTSCERPPRGAPPGDPVPPRGRGRFPRGRDGAEPALFRARDRRLCTTISASETTSCDPFCFPFLSSPCCRCRCPLSPLRGGRRSRRGSSARWRGSTKPYGCAPRPTLEPFFSHKQADCARRFVARAAGPCRRLHARAGTGRGLWTRFMNGFMNSFMISFIISFMRGSVQVVAMANYSASLARLFRDVPNVRAPRPIPTPFCLRPAAGRAALNSLCAQLSVRRSRRCLSRTSTPSSKSAPTGASFPLRIPPVL